MDVFWSKLSCIVMRIPISLLVLLAVIATIIALPTLFIVGGLWMLVATLNEYRQDIRVYKLDKGE